MTESEKKTCRELAKKIRQHCLQMVYKGKSGHIGSMLSMADILPVTYTKILHVDPKNPKMEDRDRFLLSKGHGGAALLALLAELGFFDKSWLNEYYCDNGKLSGHVHLIFHYHNNIHSAMIYRKIRVRQVKQAEPPRHVLCSGENGLGLPSSGFSDPRAGFLCRLQAEYPPWKAYFRYARFFPCIPSEDSAV